MGIFKDEKSTRYAATDKPFPFHEEQLCWTVSCDFCFRYSYIYEANPGNVSAQARKVGYTLCFPSTAQPGKWKCKHCKEEK